MSIDKENTKEKILAAASVVVMRDGAMGFTLDQVAKEAGISKGGLFYHFPTKDALLSGMVEIMISDFEASANSRITKDQVETGRFLRAYLAEVAAPQERGSLWERRKHMTGALIAAIANDQRLIDPLRVRQKMYQERIENDGVDLVDAAIIRLVADGLWLSEVFELRPVGADLQAKVCDRLRKLSYGTKKGVDTLTKKKSRG